MGTMKYNPEQMTVHTSWPEIRAARVVVRDTEDVPTIGELIELPELGGMTVHRAQYHPDTREVTLLLQNEDYRQGHQAEMVENLHSVKAD